MSWDVLNIIPTGGAPTVFELVLQQRLVAGFRPAFDHFVDSGLVRAVPRLVALAAFKDEAWAAIHLLVEYSYLNATRALWWWWWCGGGVVVWMHWVCALALWLQSGSRWVALTRHAARMCNTHHMHAHARRRHFG